MLNTLLRWFEQAPTRRIQPALLDDETTQANCFILQALGALRWIRKADEILCPSCLHYRVQPFPSSTGERAHCPECGATDMPPGYTDVLEIHPPWLLNQLSENFQATSNHRPEELERDLLWRIRRLHHLGKPVDVLFARVPGHGEYYDRIARLLVDQDPHVRQIVLLSRRSALRQLEQPGRRVVVSIEDHAYLDAHGFRLDAQMLLDRLRSPSREPPATVEVALDGAWLRVNGRELRLRHGKQRDFTLIMADAYARGNRRPKLEWVLRQAGYGEGTSELKHITKRPDFFEFFGYGNGEVWIRAEVAIWPDSTTRPGTT